MKLHVLMFIDQKCRIQSTKIACPVNAGTSVITDIDNDGKPEVIVTGRYYECLR